MSGFTVGQETVLVVGMEGIVQSVSEDGVTIGGIRLPTRLDHDRGVRYLSVVWPDADPCVRDHCDEAEPADSDARDDLDTLATMIRAGHEERHFSESMRFCNDPICREVYAIEVAS